MADFLTFYLHPQVLNQPIVDGGHPNLSQVKAPPSPPIHSSSFFEMFLVANFCYYLK